MKERNKIIEMIKDLKEATTGEDKYFVGMRNGFECVLATLESKEPIYEEVK